MEKSKRHPSEQNFTCDFLELVASVTTFMQECNNVELSKNLSKYIAYYMWQLADPDTYVQSSASKELYISFVSDVMNVFLKFGETNEYKTYKRLWLLCDF